METIISVIIPAYNVENYLNRSVESVRSQTHGALDIIIVNDGSTDNTGAMARSLASQDDRVRVFDQEHSGTATARLLGIRHAKGAWIGFVDADDEIGTDMYERLLSNAVRYNKRVSQCGVQHHLLNGDISSKDDSGIISVMDRHEALRKMNSVPPHMHIVNKIFHRDLFVALDSPPELLSSIRFNEDILINYLLCREADGSVYEAWCPYHYHYRMGSATLGGPDKSHIFDTIQVRDYIRQTIDREAYIEAQMAYVWSCINRYEELESCGTEYEEELQLIRSLIEKERPTFKDLGEDTETLVSLLFYDTDTFRFLTRKLKDNRRIQQNDFVL